MDTAEELPMEIEDTWLRYDISLQRTDETSPITIQLEQSSQRYKISWAPEQNRLSVTACARAFNEDPTYALAEMELTDAESEEKVYWLCIISVKQDRMLVWWLSDKKLRNRAKALNLEMDFESSFPFGSTVKCEPKNLMSTVLSNPAAVVGEPEIYYRQKAK